MTSFFTKITDKFQPLGDPTTQGPPPPKRRPLTIEEVRTKLKASKKPSSTVEGDLLPRLVKAFHHDLAVPARTIFNAVLRDAKWPTKWKTETTVVIPKCNNPGSLSECRNISCTPYLSKVLESVLLEDLRNEIPIGNSQYGGLKSCSVNHLLIDLFDKVLGGLDEGNHAIVLGIDFEKAFNRLDHGQCLEQLRALGASETSVSLIRSFLSGRVMRTRIGTTLSDPKPLKGGSPQGSILGCLLYCLATQQLNTSLAAAGPHSLVVSPGADPPSPASTPERSPSSPEPGGFFLMPHGLDDSQSDEGEVASQDGSFLTAEGSPINAADLTGQENPIYMFKYIDDTTTVEIVDKSQAVRHFTTNTTVEKVPANATASVFMGIEERAKEIGMAVNTGKTQMVVVAPDNGCNTTAEFEAGNAKIASQESIKLLGFLIGSSSGMTHQVKHIRARFRAHFWSLIHLRGAGIRGRNLYRLYTVFVRPILESNAVVLHSQLTRTQCQQIERLQGQVLRLCFGGWISYARAREEFQIDTLEDRREKAVEKFVRKNINNPRFGPRWFPRRGDVDVDLRHRRRFEETRAKTQKYFRSPLLYMQRMANTIPM